MRHGGDEMSGGSQRQTTPNLQEVLLPLIHHLPVIPTNMLWKNCCKYGDQCDSKDDKDLSSEVFIRLIVENSCSDLRYHAYCASDYLLHS